MRKSLSFLIRKLLKIDVISMAAFLCLTSLTVFGVTLEPGQKLFIDGEAFVIGNKLGEGASADVYQIQSETDPDKKYVMRSPIVAVNESEATAKKSVDSFLTSLRGFSLITSIDPDQTKWRWSPRIINVPLNPYRTIRTYEKLLRWDKTHTEPVVIIPLAKGTLTEIVNSKPNISNEDRLRLSVSVYNNLTPELKHLFAAKLVHGDIKPDNILIDHLGNAGLNDFEGVIKQGGTSERVTNDFYAPEFGYSNGQLTYAADLYSTAKTLLWILMDETTWSRRGVTWTSSTQTSIQYGVIREELERIRQIAIQTDIENQEVVLKVIDFVEHALQPDPIQRILQVRKHIPEFKDLEIPIERPVLKTLVRQSGIIKTKAFAGVLLSVLSGDFFIKSSPLQTNSDELPKLKSLFLKSKFNDYSLEALKHTPITQVELQLLTSQLSSVNAEYRAWAALRILASGEINEKALNVFLTESAFYLELNSIEKIVPIEILKQLDIRNMIQLLHEQIRNKGKTEGVLKVISILDINTVLNSTDAFSLMKLMDHATIKYFSRFLIKQNVDLERLTHFLVNQCVEGHGTALIENLPNLAKFVTKSHQEMLLVSATQRTQYDPADSQRVLSQLSKLGYSSEPIERYLKRKKPGFQLPEAFGLYRYRQTQSRTCHDFYGN